MGLITHKDICAYYLYTLNRLYNHAEHLCVNKRRAKKRTTPTPTTVGNKKEVVATVGQSVTKSPKNRNLHNKCHSNLNFKDSNIECNNNNGVSAVLSNRNEQTCKCDRGRHVNCQVEALGQTSWQSISKTDLVRLDIGNIVDKCTELLHFMKQQKQHTGFIPLSQIMHYVMTL